MITNQPLGTLLGLLPAVMLGFGALVCAAVAAGRPRTRPSLYRWMSLLATAGAFTASLIELLAMRPSASGVGLVAYSGGLMVDRFHVFGTVLVCLLLVLTVLGSQAYMRRVPARAGAFCALLQVSAGASVMLLAQREMSAFVAAFAVLIISLTLLTAMTKTSSQTAEAAFRQVLTGGVALATTVYGMTLLYAADGTTDLAKLTAGVRVHGAPIDGVLVVVGVALVVVGLLVVVGAPPLQAWIRNTQEVANGAIAGFSSALGAVTGTAVLARFAVEGFGAGSPRWTLLVDVLAAVAMLSGGVLALRATTIRRLIADLSIAQAGFLLLALAATGRGIGGSGWPVQLLCCSRCWLRRLRSWRRSCSPASSTQPGSAPASMRTGAPDVAPLPPPRSCPSRSSALPACPPWRGSSDGFSLPSRRWTQVADGWSLSLPQRWCSAESRWFDGSL